MIKDPWFAINNKNNDPFNFIWNTNKKLTESEILPDPFNSSTEIGSFLKNFRFIPSKAPLSTASFDEFDKIMERFSTFSRDLNDLKEKRKIFKIKNNTYSNSSKNSISTKNDKFINSKKKEKSFLDKFKESLKRGKQSLKNENENENKEKEVIYEQEKREKIRESIVRDKQLKAKQEKESIFEEIRIQKIRESIVRDQQLKAKQEKEAREKRKSQKYRNLVEFVQKHYEGKKNPYSEYVKNSLPYLVKNYDLLVNKFGKLNKGLIEETISKYHKLPKAKNLPVVYTLNDISISEKIKNSIKNSLRQIDCNDISITITSNFHLIQKGINYLGYKNYREAKKTFQDILNNLPEPIENFDSLVKMIAVSKSRHKELDNNYVKNLCKYIEISLINFLIGETLFALKNYEDACLYYEMSLKTNPSFSLAYFGYAQSGFKKNSLGDSFFEQATLANLIPFLDQAINIQKDQPEFYALRGLLRFLITDYDLSIINYQKASKLDPNSADYFYRIAHVNSFIYSYEKSISFADQAIKLQPQHEDAHYVRARSNLGLKNYKNAIIDFSKLIKLNSKNKLALFGRGSVYLAQKEYDKAIQDFSTIIYANQSGETHKNSKNDLFFKRNLRKLLCDLDQYNEFGGIPDDFDGSDFLIKDLDLNILSLYQRGVSYANRREYEKSLKDFIKVKSLDENFANVGSQLTRVKQYTNQAKSNSSIKELEKFQRSTIINFSRPNLSHTGESLKSYLLKNSLNIKEFSNQTKLNKIKKFKKYLNWHIQEFADLYLFTETIKNIPCKTKKRSFQELMGLIKIIQEKNIDLFVVIKGVEDNLLGEYIKGLNTIFINGNCFFDIDVFCSTITHELIHYLQYDVNKGPLGLEIADEIVNLKYFWNTYYDSITNKDFITELEAYTYDDVPNFIPQYLENEVEIYEKFSISQTRKKTINWIAKNRMLPLFVESISPNKVLDFSSENI